MVQTRAADCARASPLGVLGRHAPVSSRRMSPSSHRSESSTRWMPQTRSGRPTIEIGCGGLPKGATSGPRAPRRLLWRVRRRSSRRPPVSDPVRDSEAMADAAPGRGPLGGLLAVGRDPMSRYEIETGRQSRGARDETHLGPFVGPQRADSGATLRPQVRASIGLPAGRPADRS